MAESNGQRIKAPHHVRVPSPEFTKYQEYTKTFALDLGYLPFGAEVATGLRNVSESTDKKGLFIHFGTENKDEIRKHVISESRGKLQSIFENDKLRKYAEDFFYETVADPVVIQQATEEGRGDVFSAGIVPQDMFNQEVVSDEMYLLMLDSHVRNFARKEARFRERVPEMTERFLGELSPDLRKRAEERLPYIEFHLMDLLTNPDKISESGSYNPLIGKLRVASQLSDEQTEYVFTHEMVHVIAGQKVLSVEDPFSVVLPEAGKQKMKFTRDGLGLSGKKRTWLNEAVTEYLTRETLNKDQDLRQGFYNFERFVFIHLLTKGSTELDPLLFVKAYLEDFNPDVHKPGQTPAREALLTAVNKVYRPGFLAQLDGFIEATDKKGESGIVAAMQKMVTDWREIPITPHDQDTSTLL